MSSDLSTSEKNDLDLLSYYEGVEFTRTAETTAYKYKCKFNIEKVYNSLQTNIFQVRMQLKLSLIDTRST